MNGIYSGTVSMSAGFADAIGAGKYGVWYHLYVLDPQSIIAFRRFHNRLNAVTPSHTQPRQVLCS